MTPQGRQPPPHLPLKPAGGLPDGSARARDIDAVPARDWDRATSFWPNDQQRGWPPRSRPGGSSFRPSGPNGIGRRSPSPPPPPRRDFDRERERDRERDHPRERERERERDPHHPRERERERGERGERGDHGISREWAQYDREREARVREQDRREQDRREPRRSRALERADRAFDPRERDREREERERRFRDTDRYRGDDRPLTAPRSPPRSHSRPLSPPPRRRRDDRPLPGPGPSTMAQRSPSVRSVSPDNKAPSPAGGELEEGEVVSPVRPTRWNGDREPRDRSRRWPSPGPGRERDRDRDRDRDIRDREREPRDRDRDRDRGGAWQWRRSRPNSRQRSPASPAGQSFIRPSDDGWATRRRAATSPAQSWRSGSRPRSPQSRDRSPDEREAKPDIERRESEEDRRRSDDEPRKEREPSPTPAPVVEAKVDVVVPSMAHDEAAAREPTPTPTSTSASDRAGDAAHNESIHAASEFEPGQVTSAVAETEVMSESPLAEEPASSAQDAAKSPSPAVKPAVNLTSFEPPEEVAQPAASSVEPVIKAEPEPEPLAQVDGTTHVSPPSPIAQVPEQVESAQEEADVEDPAAEVVIANLATEVKERSPQPEEPVRPEATEPHAPPPPVKVLRRDTPPTEPIAAELVIQEPSTSDPVIDAHDVPEAVAETLPAPTNESPADVKMASVPTTPRSVPPLQAPPPDVDIEMTDLAQPTGSEESSVAPAEVKPPVEPVAAEYEAAQVEDASIEPKPKDFAYAEAEPELTVTTATEVLADISVEMEPAEVVAVLTENAPMEPLVEAAATLTAEGVVDKVICAADPEPVMVKAQTPEPTESFVQAVPEPLTLKAQVESEPPTDDVEMTDVNSTPLAEAEAAEVIEKTVTFLSPERGNVSLARTTRSTIADRRLVDLPDREPLPRSSKDRLRDPNPTVESVQASTDAETEVDDEEEPMDPYELLLREKVMAAMAVLPLDVDVDAIIKWNRECAPTESSRVPEDPNFIVDEMIKDVIRPLKEEQKRVVPHVAVIVGHEKAELDAKVEYLREDYLEKDREWHEHCERLDRLMEKRGPPPADLYAIPGSILPPATPGLPPTTPIVEETFPSRSNRRRGAGDAVATEAEYQAILAGLADSAAKDPTHRATKTAATIPDMILTKERDFVYDDENYRVDDPLKFYDFAGVAEQIWTDEERTKFLKRYLQYPKQFGKIAEGLPDKTAGDCVLYYYRTKYAKDYKTTLASRRGVKARRAVAKKKSSALMADIERQKQTTGGGKSKREREREARAEREREKTDGGSATGTPQPNGRKPRARVADTPSVAGEETPGPPSRKRKPEDKTDNEESATPSRATSEAPSNVSKKQRIPKSGGKKRPRPSSFKEEKEPAPGPAVSAMTSATPTTPAPVASDLSQQATLDHAAAVAIASMNGAPPPPAPDSVAESPGPLILDPTTQLPIDTGPLLPPVKRAKRRKQNHPPLDEAEVAVAEAASTPKPRRSGTNSYWSVAEKTKFPELVREHGTDFRAIADKLGGTKTVVQVRNHYNLTIDELRGKGIVQPQTNEVGVRDVKVNGAADAYGGFPPLRPGHEYSPPGARRTSHEFPEPRMAVFPPSPHQHTVPPPLAAAGVLSTSATPSAPPSRSGGMRISALLNDDPPKERAFDTASIASDGTVDERDFGNEGTPLRPSPRPPPAPAPKPIYHDYDQRASFDERERELERERFEQEHAGFRPASTGYSYAAAAAGTPAWRHDPRDPRGDPRPRDSRDPRDPRDPRADPRAEPRDVRIDPRADPRADPRPDPRMDPRERERLERDRLERERHDHVRLEAARHHELRDHHDPHARDPHARDPRDVRDPRDNRDPRDAHRDPRDYYPSTHHSPPHTHTHAGPGPLPPVSRLSSGPGPLPSLGVFPPSQHSGHSAQIPHHVHHPMAHQGQVHHSREYGRQQSDWRPYLAAPNGERGEYPQR